ncbi:MAG TPA: PAS domain S-box protein [Bryobacteraceae bacterium]|nr:PAS domain S-box protein [Bryobacteraceae bacterium]
MSLADLATTREQELRERVAWLEGRVSAYERVFLENPVPAIVYAADTLQILEANERALALYGYERQQLRSLSVIELFAPDTHRSRSALKAELRKPLNSIGPLVHRGAAKQELVVSLIIFAFETEGRAARIVMVQDETARHLAEEKLKSSEERFRELFENANDVIFLHDLKGTIQAVNRATEYLTGYSRTEMLGKNFADLVAPEARHQTMDSVRAHLGGSATQHYELPIISKFGALRFLEVSTRILYRRGHPVAVQGIGRDVTERKQAQQRLLESSRELQEKNEELSTALRLAREATQLKEQFLANTSHELRTPMNGIMGMVNLLKSTELTADQREYAEAVSQCANDLLTIINDLLDLSQIEAGRLSLTDEPFDSHESLKTVVKLLRLRADSKGLLLTHEIDPRLPDHIYGDSVRFRQILTNLIANAIKFTPSGGVHVKLDLQEADGMLHCEVVDSGIGVADSVRERIFEAFCQADGTTRRRFGGTGLGLTISKQLVENMGGRIGSHDNHPAPGSTFWFDLPLRPAQTPGSDANLASDPVEVA